MSYEVDRPILNNPFDEPSRYWFIREGHDPELRESRRPSIVYPPREGNTEWDLGDVLTPSTPEEFAPGYEMKLVNQLRERVKEWRSQSYPGVTRTTLDLLHYWNRDGREKRLFFTQKEAVETIIFLTEARRDLLQGINIPVDRPVDPDLKAFTRYACKMATGSGKTTVMGMLAAWSILNKVNDRSDTRFSDIALVVCPNVTIKSRLQELDPVNGEASIYRTRDLVPPHLMGQLRQGKVLITNWHIFERRSPSTTGSDSAKVVKVGVKTNTTETIKIGRENTTARGTRYLTEEKLEEQKRLGLIKVLEEKTDRQGNLTEVKVLATRYLESEAAWIRRILSQEIGNKGKILVFNDEAHHAYRITPNVSDDDRVDDEDEREYDQKEATIWIEGLDRIHKYRTINLCIDLSATPYYLRASAQDANKPFPWVVSDFSLMDSIESGLVKIPQLPIRDTTGAITSNVAYFNIWQWIMNKMTPTERGRKGAAPKPEAVLKYAQHPITLLAGQWEETRLNWLENPDDPRPPVLIVVCKNTKIAKVVYEWIAEDTKPSNVTPFALRSLLNTENATNTIRVDSKVVEEIESGNTKTDDSKWMRFTLDTIGLINWPSDHQQRPIYPEGFAELATKLEQPLHPPGRDIRCIISVGMLTEGWSCQTVTHIIGIRPFMSQLLCEQVVGRGLRRRSYELNEDDKFAEETAKIFGVPFEVTPFKANQTGKISKPGQRNRVYSVATKSKHQIEFPRIYGYSQGIQNKVTVDWDAIAPVTLDPTKIPPEVQVKATLSNNKGRPSINGPGKLERLDLNPYRKNNRLQTLIFELAADLTKTYCQLETCEAPSHVLFPQLQTICEQYLNTKVNVVKPCNIADAWLSPYYGWIIDNLATAIHPDTTAGESPEIPRYETHQSSGSTDDIDFWTSKPVYPIENSHLNAVVADTLQWEQATAYFVDRHPITESFVKNERLGFTIPYFYNGNDRDYHPDFIIRLKAAKPRYLILETKGYLYDGTEEKKAAAERWVRAVNADGRFGEWQYKMCKLAEVHKALDEVMNQLTQQEPRT